MQVIKGEHEVLELITNKKNMGADVGFVPTMGALHEGHLSLIRKSKQIFDYTVASIFVNPKQFNDPDDYSTYPRTLNMDIAKLAGEKCDAVFIPLQKTVYPYGYLQTEYPIGDIRNIWEGAHRPGHFQGVLQVVDRLLDLIPCTGLFLGQKDYQQYLILNWLLTQNRTKGEKIILCPIVREADGLAMSSRNKKMLPEERIEAARLSQFLNDAVNQGLDTDFNLLKKNTIKGISSLKFVDSVDYFEFLNADNLQSINGVHEAENIIICTAVNFKSARLIDNLFLKKNGAFLSGLS